MNEKQFGPTRIVLYTCKGCDHLASRTGYGFFAYLCMEPTECAKQEGHGSPVYTDEPTPGWCALLHSKRRTG